MMLKKKFKQLFLQGREDSLLDSNYYKESHDIYLIYTIVGKKVYFLPTPTNSEKKLLCKLYVQLAQSIHRYDISSDQLRSILRMAYEYGMAVVPSIEVCHIPMISKSDKSIFYQAFVRKQDLLVVLKTSHKGISVAEPFGKYEVKILKSYLFSLLNNYKNLCQEFSAKIITKSQSRSFSLSLLNKNFTLNRGYGLYPFLDNKLMFDEIFYSFDENEILEKIDQLFVRYG